MILARITCGALRAAPVFLQEEPLHAEAVVGLGQHVRKPVEDAPLHIGAEIILPPDMADPVAGFLLDAVGLQGEGKGDPAGRGPRGLLCKVGAHLGCRSALCQQRILAASADRTGAGPFRIILLECDDPVQADGKAAADGEPFHQGMGRGLGQLGLEDLSLGQIVVPIGLEDALEIFQVSRHRSGGHEAFEGALPALFGRIGGRFCCLNGKDGQLDERDRCQKPYERMHVEAHPQTPFAAVYISL